MTAAFVRQLGAESGVQLNPLRDASEVPSQDNADQVFGIIMRCARGRIDKPFVVDKGNVYTKLGNGEQIRVSALNESWVHVVEALNKGAYEAVIQRLVTDEAKVKWAAVKPVEDGTGFTFEVSEEEPSGCLFAVKHLECFNDGIKLAFHAEDEEVDGEDADQAVITLRILDKDDNKLYEFTGSLNKNAVDDFGNSYWLPDVVAGQTDCVEVKVGVTPEKAVVAAGSDAYGWDENGEMKWAESDVLVCFEEGSTAYSTQNYIKARENLENSPNDFAYISSGGTQAPALLAQLALLAFNTNRQLRFDVPGNLTPEAAIAFVKQLNMGAKKCSHLLQAFWCPCKSDDPTGVNPKGYFGVATLNIALACARNAEKNAKGFAPKNYPIAGRDYPIDRERIEQTYSPRSQEYNALAKAKINPCVYESYTGGGRYVFRDSITCALVDQSLRKLIAVADMSTSVDDAVTRAAKDYLQKPMKVAVQKMKDFLRDYFAAAEASDWLVPSDDPQMGGKAYVYDVRPNEAKPYDTMDVRYWVRYDGTARQIFVTQTLTR